MDIEDMGSFKLNGMEVTTFKINSVELNNREDINEIVTKFFNRRKNKYNIIKQYEFYDKNGDLIEESEFLKILDKDKIFIFNHTDKVGNLKTIMDIDKNYYLKKFNEIHLSNSLYKATDIYIFDDGKLDNIKITFQIKVEIDD